MDPVSQWARPELIWFLIGLAMFFLELALPGLIIFFFGVGAWVAALLCAVADVGLNTQLMVFLGVSVACILTLRRWLTSVFRGRVNEKSRDNMEADEYRGRKAVVVKAIEPGLGGRVEFRGVHWDACSDESIPVGTAVSITGKDNITFSVKTIHRG